MVGHSQLESDMLEASPLPTAAADDEEDVVDTPAECAPAAAAAEAPTAQDDTSDETEAGNSCDGEALQGVQNSPARQAAAQGSPMPVPQPGRKRKRSSLCRVIHDEDAGPVGLRPLQQLERP